MAHLAFSNKDKGFYPVLRKDFDLGWTFFNERGEVIGTQARKDLTPYEHILVNKRKRDMEAKRKARPRVRLKK